MTEDEMVGWHHQFNGHEFEQALGVKDKEACMLQSVESQRVLVTEQKTRIHGSQWASQNR